MCSDPSFNLDYPLYGFEYVCSDKNGDMYKKNGEFYYLKVAYINGRREGKAEMKCMGEEKPVCILCYQNDILNGQCAYFNENGHVFECMMKDDVLDGPFAEYDEKGNVICQGEYKNGQRMPVVIDAAHTVITSPTVIAACTMIVVCAVIASWAISLRTDFISATLCVGALFLITIGGSNLPFLLLVLWLCIRINKL